MEHLISWKTCPGGKDFSVLKDIKLFSLVAPGFGAPSLSFTFYWIQMKKLETVFWHVVFY